MSTETWLSVHAAVPLGLSSTHEWERSLCLSVSQNAWFHPWFCSIPCSSLFCLITLVSQHEVVVSAAKSCAIHFPNWKLPLVSLRFPDGLFCNLFCLSEITFPPEYTDFSLSAFWFTRNSTGFHRPSWCFAEHCYTICRLLCFPL